MARLLPDGRIEFPVDHRQGRIESSRLKKIGPGNKYYYTLIPFLPPGDVDKAEGLYRKRHGKTAFLQTSGNIVYLSGNKESLRWKEVKPSSPTYQDLISFLPKTQKDKAQEFFQRAKMPKSRRGRPRKPPTTRRHHLRVRPS